ncbi:cell wall binding repeat-containing protein [Clostridium sp. DL-VIII]|uniref:cadherin-like beta sandwich domain-containing protein n=1 Tax=Clostridium sp. DL-VIII TaxID=641107 RepID=UPI00023B078E|nr:cadherin-like beta sandwich domain-containing protein [Clostridium sp. DL-VIII]EHJ02146.1 cell wall binding repeat-containing protein [Clostridium sp. DL-VIII]
MNKNIKRIIAMTLAISAFSIASPVKFINSVDTAYASSDDDKDAIENSYLDDLDISEGDLSFSKKKTEYTVKVDSSDSTVVITAKAKDRDDKIKIDGEEVPLDDNRKAQKEVELDKGRNMIKIKVETEDYGIRTYNLVINRGSASNDSDSDSDDVYLDNIILSDGDIDFSEDKMSYNVNVNSSVNEIRIAAKPEDEDDDVKIDGIRVYKYDDFRRMVSLNNGENKILIELQDSEGKEQTYTLNINRGGTAAGGNTSEVIDNEQDPIYLDDIVIQGGDVPLKFKPKVTSYAVDVNEDWDSIILKAKPEFDDVVRVNGSTTEDPYIRRINLNEGKNVITIKINNSNTYDRNDDEYEERIYTVTVYRGTSDGKSQSNTSSNAQVTGKDVKTNQWVNINGKWQYNDSIGNPLKSTWYFDKNYGKNYYFKEDGTMATGWISYNGSWYYLDNSGAMVTGWLRDNNGVWYYLYSSGVMAANTIIDGYSLGPNGDWIK